MSNASVYVIHVGGGVGLLADRVDPLRQATIVDGGAERDTVTAGASRLGIRVDFAPLLEDDGEPHALVDSANSGPAEWRLLARQIGDAYELYDGFVVLHGTDTLAYTASALSFMLEDLSKPVVFTGAKVPLYEPRTDAFNSMLNAIALAGYEATGLPRLAEVVVCFGPMILRANRTRMLSAAG